MIRNRSTGDINQVGPCLVFPFNIAGFYLVKPGSESKYSAFPCGNEIILNSKDQEFEINIHPAIKIYQRRNFRLAYNSSLVRSSDDFYLLPGFDCHHSQYLFNEVGCSKKDVHRDLC